MAAWSGSTVQAWALEAVPDSWPLLCFWVLRSRGRDGSVDVHGGTCPSTPAMEAPHHPSRLPAVQLLWLLLGQVHRLWPGRPGCPARDNAGHPALDLEGFLGASLASPGWAF